METQAAHSASTSIILPGRQEALPPLGGIDIQDSHLASDGTLEGLVHFVFTRHLLIRLGTVH